MHAIDIETTALSPEDGDIRLVQLYDDREVVLYDAFYSPEKTIKALQQLGPVAAHNAPFEARWLADRWGVTVSDLHDTLVMSRVLYGGTNAANNKRFTHGLASVVKRELGVDLPKDEQTSDWSQPVLSLEQLEYAARDALYTGKLADVLLSKIEDAELIEHFGLEDREDWPLTAGGSPSTNQEAMKLLGGTVPSIDLWLEWKKVEKLRSTYGTSLLKKVQDGRIHARFHQFGTTSVPSSGPGIRTGG